MFSTNKRCRKLLRDLEERSDRDFLREDREKVANDFSARKKKPRREEPWGKPKKHVAILSTLLLLSPFLFLVVFVFIVALWKNSWTIHERTTMIHFLQGFLLGVVIGGIIFFAFNKYQLYQNREIAVPERWLFRVIAVCVVLVMIIFYLNTLL